MSSSDESIVMWWQRSHSFICPITGVRHSAVLEECSHRTSALDLCNKSLKLRMVVASFQIGLHACYQANTVPIRVTFFATNKSRSRQLSFYRNIPLANCDTKIFCDKGARDLIAWAQTGEWISDWRGMGLVSTKDGIGIGRKFELFALYRYSLDETSSLTGDLDGDEVERRWRVAELPETWVGSGTRALNSGPGFHQRVRSSSEHVEV